MAVIRKLERNDSDSTPPPSRVRKSRFSKEHDESNWLISYADMMTLLCVFYIMLFSMSKINTPEFEKVKKQVSEHFGTKYESPTEDLGKFVTQLIQENGLEKEVTITSDGMSVSLAFHSTLFFGSMSAEISDQGRAILDKMIHALKAKEEQIGKHYKMVVEGHTDSQPIVGGPFPSNWELSSSRATRVIRRFLEEGFQGTNLLAIGYADTQPIVESRNPDGTWNTENLAKNRRVVLRVLLPEVDTIPWQMKPEAQAETGQAGAGQSTSAIVAPAVVAPSNP